MPPLPVPIRPPAPARFDDPLNRAPRYAPETLRIALRDAREGYAQPGLTPSQREVWRRSIWRIKLLMCGIEV